MRSTFCQDIGQCSPVVACRLRGICLLLQLRLPTLSLSLWFMAQGKHVQTFVVVISFGFESQRLVVYNLLMGPALGLIMPDRRTVRQHDIGHVFAHLVLSWLSGLLR